MRGPQHVRRRALAAAAAAAVLAVAGCTDSTGELDGGPTTSVSTPTVSADAESASPATGAGTAAPTRTGGATAGGTATDDDAAGTDDDTAPGSATPSQTLDVIDAGGVTLLVARTGGDGGDTALVFGELTSGPGGCLALVGQDGPPVLVVWPAGTEVEPGARPQVDAPGVGVVTVGERLEHAGGFVASSAFDIPQHCLDGSAAEVAVLNAG